MDVDYDEGFLRENTHVGDGVVHSWDVDGTSKLGYRWMENGISVMVIRGKHWC